MAKSKAQDKPQPQQDAESVYNEHNDVSAQDWPEDKQCQCETCKAYRSGK